MKATNFKMIIMLIAISLIGFNSNALAQRGNGNMNGNGNFQNALNLTDAQKKSIKELRVAQQKEMLQNKNQLRELQARLTTLRSAENADMTEINKTIDEITAIRNKQMKQQEANRQAIRSLLTDEQKVIFDSRQNKKAGKGKKTGKVKGNCGGNNKAHRQMNKANCPRSQNNF